MRYLLLTVFLLPFAFVVQSAPVTSQANDSAGWDYTGELSYSYAYARNWIGNKMRIKGWRCTKAFTVGANHTCEHSVWVKGKQKVQMMIWRVSSDKTCFSQKCLSKNGFQRIL